MIKTKIADFCKKYGVNRRSVDYWTNIGILHPKVNSSNHYRDYSVEAEREMKDILTVQVLNKGRVSKKLVDELEDRLDKERQTAQLRGRVQENYHADQKRYGIVMDYLNERIGGFGLK